MTTASDTPTTADPALRTWCCGTPVTGPHIAGCINEPSEDNPVDYSGPVEVLSADEADTSEEAAESEAASDVWKHEEDWAYESLPFHGDILGIRIPNAAAIQGWQLSQSSTNSEAFQINGTNRLLIRHMSPNSYGRLIFRLGEPDDPDYDGETFSEMVHALVDPGLERAQADAAARAKVSK